MVNTTTIENSKEIIILCTGKDWKMCPFDAEVWGLNGVYKHAKVDRLFITDKMFTDYPDHPNFDVEAMNKLGIPIVSRNHIEGLKYESYPWKEICEHFQTTYFANSVCYMLAYALYGGVKKIRIYGGDMSWPREIVEQKPCMEYWIGRAQGMGTEVQIIGNTTLMKYFTGLPYGFSDKEFTYEVDGGRNLEYWHLIVESVHREYVKDAEKRAKKKYYG